MKTDNVVNMNVQRSIKEFEDVNNSSDKSYGSGGGGGGNMESRVLKLESDVSDIKANMNQILFKLDGINSALSKQPSEDKLNLMMAANNTNLLESINNSISKLPTEDKLTLKIIESNSKVMEVVKGSISKLPTEDKINFKFAENKTELVKISSEIKIEAANTEAKLKDVRLQIILWILGLPALVFAIFKFYDLLTK